MKRVIFLMFFVAVIGCHESNSVEPVLDNIDQLNRFDDVNGTLDNPLKNGEAKTEIFSCNYNFNPTMNIGKVRNGSLSFIIDNEAKEESFLRRYFYDVEVEAPSQIVVNNKTFPTKNIYTINRIEKVTKGGKVISGETWGTFKIYQIGGSNPLIFQGEFTGEIELKTAILKLTGKGLMGNYLGRNMIASEQQVCTASGGELHCWTSNMEGSILPLVKNED